MTGPSVFSLEGRSLKLNTAADIAPYIEELKANSDVEEIRLNGNTLGIEACEALAKVLENRKSLKVAEFADIFTGRLREEIPKALSALGNALLTCPNLHTVNLSDNAFGLMTEAPLISFLSQHGPLQHLILANNGLGPYCGTSIAKALTKLAELKKTDKDLPALETVICGRNRLENGSMEAWSEAFRAHGKVKTVKMVQNGIRPEGIEQLIRHGLSTCTDLETLDLQDNTFTLKGSQALAKAVVGWTKLTELGVGDCLLGSKGAHLVFNALAEGKNKGLKILRLQFNDIEPPSARALKDSLKQLPVLEKLELNGNKFSEDDPVVEDIKEIFDERGVGELDDLDDMEVDSDGEDEKEESEAEEEKEDIVKRAQEAEAENTSQEKDNKVDDLADLLAKKAAI
ncbi:hypothetical protein DFH27DRAFT_153745 [Peziza echinospora]|nr:hypothetical protein DFH27DRAFT_153745 [Peziza echinospora]